jgi:hypothetical protein
MLSSSCRTRAQRHASRCWAVAVDGRASSLSRELGCVARAGYLFSMGDGTMDHDTAIQALAGGDLVEAEIATAADANGWVLLFTTRSGDQVTYTDHTGTEKVYHDLDQVTEVAREIGFDSIRVHEDF